MPSILNTIATEVLVAAEANKPAILAALAAENISIEAFVAAAVKADIKNPLLAAVISQLIPNLSKQLPSLEAAAFASLDTLIKVEIAKL
jgi:hypothetical protein